MKEFLEMVNKYLHFRTAHSELVGFWYSELGAMNKVFHIWKYGMVSIPLCCSALSVFPVSWARRCRGAYLALLLLLLLL